MVRHAIETGFLPNRPLLVFGVSGALALMMTLGVVLTASRFGMVLLPVALLGMVVTLRPWLKSGIRNGLLGLLLASMLGLGAWSAVSRIPALSNAVARFDLDEEGRPDIWRDSYYALSANFPVGAGMGNFVPAYLAGERLESVGSTFPNRAHNDFLELGIEAGLLGLTALSLCSVILGRAALKSLRKPATDPAGLTTFALFSLLVLALHSLVDYPLRSMALACLGAACAGMLFPPRPVRSGPAHPEEVAEPQ